jgi:ABC-type dipeptide/oligopeptide/nickel transport system permease subunit
MTQRFLLPSGQHWFGTDNLGRDVLSRVLFGGRPVLLTGVTTVLSALSLGVVIGAIGGYQGGWLDNLLMRAMDVMLSFPSVLLAILIVATIGRGQQNVIIAIAFSMVPIFARLVRASVMSVKVEDYVLAATTLGATDSAIIKRHVLPNILAPILVQATALLAVSISTATALNFIGLGVEPPDPDWGLMVSEGQKLLYDAPHVGFFPGMLITITVLSVNFLGDGLRDYLDPKLRRSQ